MLPTGTTGPRCCVPASRLATPRSTCRAQLTSERSTTLDPGVGIADLELWQGFVSTIWSPVAGLDLSLDVVYSKVKNKCANAVTDWHGDLDGVLHSSRRANGTQAATSNGIGGGGSEDIWTVWTRIRRNF